MCDDKFFKEMEDICKKKLIFRTALCRQMAKIFHSFVSSSNADANYQTAFESHCKCDCPKK
jgi:hypothetical protein